MLCAVSSLGKLRNERQLSVRCQDGAGLECPKQRDKISVECLDGSFPGREFLWLACGRGVPRRGDKCVLGVNRLRLGFGALPLGRLRAKWCELRLDVCRRFVGGPVASGVRGESRPLRLRGEWVSKGGL